MFGVAVSENARDSSATQPATPTVTMPRTVQVFKDALCNVAADSCFPVGIEAKSPRVLQQVALTELFEMHYTDLPLQAAPLIALLKEARICRCNAASQTAIQLSITTRDIVAHIMAFIQKPDHLNDNASLLNLKGQKRGPSGSAQ